jgi:hypothetical protein
MRELLEGLLPAINGIHGGCYVCLEHFVHAANTAFIEHGQPYRLEVARQQDKPNLGTVALVDVPAPAVARKRTTGEKPA